MDLLNESSKHYKKLLTLLYLKYLLCHQRIICPFLRQADNVILLVTTDLCQDASALECTVYRMLFPAVLTQTAKDSHGINASSPLIEKTYIQTIHHLSKNHTLNQA